MIQECYVCMLYALNMLNVTENSQTLSVVRLKLSIIGYVLIITSAELWSTALDSPAAPKVHQGVVD